MTQEFMGTTICAVKRNGKTAIAGDGQVTLSESVIFKSTAKKVRRIYDEKVVVFCGSVADAFTLSERFEENLPNPAPRARCGAPCAGVAQR